MRTAQLRSLFLDYFRERGHEVVPSSPLVPGQDPTLLFTNSGMVQFKDVFLGSDKRPYSRAVTAQRCVRAGGKHNDLENVGYTARHHTFFEMLGNFSFGDYFKADAIRFAWDLLTDKIGLREDSLWVTVYAEDDEAADIWLNEIGVPDSRFRRIPTSDNFWSMGDTGPCGPCSEIFYDHGPDVEGGPPGSENEDGDRFIELWNLVFMQFERFSDGSMTPLPKPSVDTGMGLERIAAVLQGVHSNYEIDLFRNLIDQAAKVVGVAESDSKSLRVIADHIRSAAFLIADGVTPSNETRGYVLRRIIRRAIRHGYQLGRKDPFFHELTGPLVEEMGEAYPELVHARDKVTKVLEREGVKFARTLEQGISILEREIGGVSGSVLPGDVAFRLYDTYGFPLDLTADYLRERDMTVDEAGFDVEMERQRDRAKSASKFETTESGAPVLDVDVSFCGYGGTEGVGAVAALVIDGETRSRIAAGDEAIVVLDETPFYAEGGGQVGDIGYIRTDGGEFQVEDTRFLSKRVIGHFGKCVAGELVTGENAQASVDSAARSATMKNHSATHLLHAALKNNLGSHVQQKGSLVDPDRLRFDFSHHEAVSMAQLRAIELEVNAEIRKNLAVSASQMGLEDAKIKGAEALFGEKYESEVRVVGMGEYSLELCGGTHVSRTGDIGLMKIVQESGIASGIRRIEAISGDAAVRRVQEDASVVQEAASTFSTSPDLVSDSIKQMMLRNRELEREVSDLKTRLAVGGGGEAEILMIGDVSLLVSRHDGVEIKDLRTIMDRMKEKVGTGVVVLGSSSGSKVTLLCTVSKDLTDRVNAADVVRQLSAMVDGQGGGKAHMAQGGGTNVDRLDAALESVAGMIG